MTYRLPTPSNKSKMDMACTWLISTLTNPTELVSNQKTLSKTVQSPNIPEEDAFQKHRGKRKKCWKPNNTFRNSPDS